VPFSKKKSSEFPPISEQQLLELLKRVQKINELNKYKINISPINISNNLSIVPYEGTALAIFKDNLGNLFPFPLIYDHDTQTIYFKILVNKKEYKLIVKKEGDNHIFELKNKNEKNVIFKRTKNIKNINKNKEIAVEINNKKTSNALLTEQPTNWNMIYNKIIKFKSEINTLKGKSINNIDAYKDQIIQIYEIAKSKNISNKKLNDLEREFLDIINKIDNIKLKKFNEDPERLGAYIGFTPETNNALLSKNYANPSTTNPSTTNPSTTNPSTTNPSTTNPNVVPSLKNRAIKSMQSMISISKNPYSRLHNRNTQSKPSYLNIIKSTISETSEKAGSFIKDQLKKVTSKKSNSRYTRQAPLDVNNNEVKELQSQKQYISPNGYTQFSN
jgi:hypothetical protein